MRALSPDSPARHGLAFGAALLAFFLVAAPEAADMIGQWTWSSSYHHGWLAAPIAAWLIAQEKAWRIVPLRFDGLGAAALVIALSLIVIGRFYEAAIVGHTSVVVGIVGAAVLTLGAPFVRRSAFAFGFLIFLVPFGESLVPLLQAAAADVVAGLLNFSGVETMRDGVLLTTAAGRFEMAESCAGLRFLLAGVMIAALAAQLAFTGWRRRALFITAAIALAITANWLRAYLIVLTATATDMKVGTGPEHVAFGWLFYGALMLGLLFIARCFGDRVRDAALASARGSVE